MGGAGGGELGAAGFGDGLEFHELDAGAVGVVEVGLPLAVAAHLGAIVFGREAVFFVERGDGGFHVGNAEGEVVEDADVVGGEVFGGGGGAVADHHVLEPVVAVGDLLGDPVEGAGLHGAEPVGTEAEEVAVEVVFVGAIVDEVADVDDAGADGVGGDRYGVRVGGLEELDAIAFGVGGFEPGGAVGGGVEFGDVRVVGEEVVAEAGGVGGVEGDAGHAAEGMVGGEGKDFYELRGAEVVTDAGRVLRVEGLGGAEDVGVEVVRGGHVVSVDAHVGNAGDGGARWLGQGGKGGEEEG